MTPAGGFRHPVTPESFEYEDFGNGIVRAPVHTLINGMDVLSFAISKPPKSIDELLKYCALNKEKDIDHHSRISGTDHSVSDSHGEPCI